MYEILIQPVEKVIEGILRVVLATGLEPVTSTMS